MRHKFAICIGLSPLKLYHPSNLAGFIHWILFVLTQNSIRCMEVIIHCCSIKLQIITNLMLVAWIADGLPLSETIFLSKYALCLTGLCRRASIWMVCYPYRLRYYLEKCRDHCKFSKFYFQTTVIQKPVKCDKKIIDISHVYIVNKYSFLLFRIRLTL